MDPSDIEKLKTFIGFVKAKPEVLHQPVFAFFKDFLLSLGATIPAAPAAEAKSDTDGSTSSSGAKSPPPTTTTPKSSDGPRNDTPPPEEIQESEESDLELDLTGCVDEEDTDMDLEMGDETLEVTEEMCDSSSELRSKAQQAQSDGDDEKALTLWGDAIKENPQSAVLFAKRAQLLLKMNKPMNAMKDADHALDLNPDQALAYRVRGRAHRLLGNWEEAQKDLSTSCNIDYTDEANDWLKEVAPQAKKIQDHKRKYERKREEKGSRS